MHTCECGERYISAKGVIDCAANNHGRKKAPLTSSQNIDPNIAKARAALSCSRHGTWSKAYAMEQFEKLLQGFVDRGAPETSDSDRLDWVLRNVSGAEWRRLGIVYSGGMTRPDLDRTIALTYVASCAGGTGGLCTQPDCKKCWPDKPSVVETGEKP